MNTMLDAGEVEKAIYEVIAFFYFNETCIHRLKVKNDSNVII